MIACPLSGWCRHNLLCVYRFEHFLAGLVPLLQCIFQQGQFHGLFVTHQCFFHRFFRGPANFRTAEPGQQRVKRRCFE